MTWPRLTLQVGGTHADCSRKACVHASRPTCKCLGVGARQALTRWDLQADASQHEADDLRQREGVLMAEDQAGALNCRQSSTISTAQPAGFSLTLASTNQQQDCPPGRG